MRGRLSAISSVSSNRSIFAHSSHTHSEADSQPNPILSFTSPLHAVTPAECMPSYYGGATASSWRPTRGKEKSFYSPLSRPLVSNWSPLSQASHFAGLSLGKERDMLDNKREDSTQAHITAPGIHPLQPLYCPALPFLAINLMNCSWSTPSPTQCGMGWVYRLPSIWQKCTISLTTAPK